MQAFMTFTQRTVHFKFAQRNVASLKVFIIAQCDGLRFRQDASLMNTGYPSRVLDAFGLSLDSVTRCLFRGHGAAGVGR